MAFVLPSYEYFSVFAASVRDRNRLIDALASYIEEYAEIEVSYGKALSKVKGVDGKSDISLAAGWESIFLFSQTTGREHASLATNLSQSIVRTLHDCSKGNGRIVQSLTMKVSFLHKAN